MLFSWTPWVLLHRATSVNIIAFFLCGVDPSVFCGFFSLRTTLLKSRCKKSLVCSVYYVPTFWGHEFTWPKRPVQIEKKICAKNVSLIFTTTRTMCFVKFFLSAMESRLKKILWLAYKKMHMSCKARKITYNLNSFFSISNKKGV